MTALGTRALKMLGRCAPTLFWRRYGRLARQSGLERLYVILSFDCDTPEDIGAAERLDERLRACGIKATYAVPGKQLEQGAAVYRRLADLGAEFINHGARAHAERRDGRYWSITFYHDMPTAEVVEDIRRGHEIVERITGRAPRGFRAPHFGLFQKPAQLAVLHQTLRELNYSYSTSTVPMFGFLHGPLHDVGGLVEVPVSGAYRSPFRVFDSWGHIRGPQEPVVKDLYAALFIETVDRLLVRGIPGVLNYYADPAHVAGTASFDRVLDHLVERRIPTLHYPELLDRPRGNERGLPC